MTLAGKQAWIALGAALLVGAVGGAFATGWSRARGLPAVEASADAGVRVGADAGVTAACECVQEVRFITREVPVYRTRYIQGDAGLVEVRVVETVPILVPELKLSGSSRAGAGVEVTGEATAAAAAKAAPEPGVSLLWGIGGGVQHDDALRGTVGAQLGVAWGRSSLVVTGGVVPTATGHWNALLLYGGRLP